MALIDDFARQRDESRKRLLWLMAVFGMLAVIVLIRLTYLQVLRADDYRKQLDKWLDQARTDYVPALRGGIRDRRGNHARQDTSRSLPREHGAGGTRAVHDQPSSHGSDPIGDSHHGNGDRLEREYIRVLQRRRRSRFGYHLGGSRQRELERRDQVDRRSSGTLR